MHCMIAASREMSDEPKIWLIIVEVVGIVAELTGADEDTLMRQLIENNKRLEALQAYAQTA